MTELMISESCSNNENDIDEYDLGNKSYRKLIKLVDNVANIVKLMKYIEFDLFENELSKRGIHLQYETLEETNSFFKDTERQRLITSILLCGTTSEHVVKLNKELLNNDLFLNEVPSKLQYDKNTNPTGLKSSDFNKLVKVYYKKQQALTDDMKQKIENKITEEAENKHFESIRNEIMREKYVSLLGE